MRLHIFLQVHNSSHRRQFQLHLCHRVVIPRESLMELGAPIKPSGGLVDLLTYNRMWPLIYTKKLDGRITVHIPNISATEAPPTWAWVFRFR